jgi:hypothetical protein
MKLVSSRGGHLHEAWYSVLAPTPKRTPPAGLTLGGDEMPVTPQESFWL